jgi:hypothetical protein
MKEEGETRLTVRTKNVTKPSCEKDEPTPNLPHRPPITQGQAATPNGVDLEETFRALADQWRKETGMLSSMSNKLRHPAYQKIIALGMPAVPLILRELRDRPGYWFEALKAITGQSPVPPDETMDPRRARERWLKWGKEERHLE